MKVDEIVPPTDVSSKDDSSPPEEQVHTDEEKHIKETEDSYHSNDTEKYDEEFEIEW